MTPPKNTSKPKALRGGRAKSTLATLRSTSGAGFEFEDLISALQLVKALSGEQALGIGGVVTQIQAQVSTLGWHIDDLLLTAQTTTSQQRLAISAKGNLQVSAAGLPADFVTRAWELWRDRHGPFNRATDGLALVTLGTHLAFDPAWREVKNACSGTDTTLAMSRIRSNTKQSRVFDSVKKPGGASDEEAIELIRCLHVQQTDLQFAHSENEVQAIAQCRRLVASGRDDEAEALWKAFINIAKEVRLRRGTITIPSLLSSLRGQFDLRNHPDFERDWGTLFDVTSDHKARIETALPSGYTVPRAEEAASLEAAFANKPIMVVFGESGSGKSALVKSVLDNAYPSWNQAWFGPEQLKMALSAAHRGALPLAHELSLVLKATTKPQNVLVIDSAEHIEDGEFVVIRRLIEALLQRDGEDAEAAWRVVIVTQTLSHMEGEESILNGRKADLFEVESLKSDAVKAALLLSPTLGWLVAHDDTVAALTNLRTLAWVMKAGVALGSDVGGMATHTAIADRLWTYWTKDRADVKALTMRLAQREASFERSFALTDLGSVDVATFTQRPHELPLRLNQRTNRIEFEHDLAADWARFQFLKQVFADTPQWAGLASNPLWTNALRMLGQFLLRQPAEIGTAWDDAFRLAEAAKNALAGDILLDAICLDPEATRFLNERVDLLLGNGAKHFTRLLRRFHHIATVPTGGGSGLNAAMGLYMEAQNRTIVFGRWPPVLLFLIAQRERLQGLISSALAKVIETWLKQTPHKLTNGDLMPFRSEMAEMALAMARNIQVEKGHGVIYATAEPVLYTAALAGAADLPNQVRNWALELAGRRKVDADVKRRIAEVHLQKAKIHAERLTTDADYKARHKEKRVSHSLGNFRERLPPWPLGASEKVDFDFRKACINEHGIQFLMRAQPELAAEVLLALIIEDLPEREPGAGRFEMDLGLEYAQDSYPTAFWKSPFFHFFAFDSGTALTTLIALVNFCTERWVAKVLNGGTEGVPGITLQFADGAERIFAGWWQVYDWPQSNEMRNGNLFSALDALERWLTLRLDAGADITAQIERIFREGNSAAFLSVLVNVAKYRPSLLSGPLAPLMTFPSLFFWDDARVNQIGHNFVGWSWIRGGQPMFDFARDWVLAPHRQKKFLDVVIQLLLTDGDVAQRIQVLLPTCAVPENPGKAFEFKFLFAQLNRANYQTITDSGSGAERTVFVCPDALSHEYWSSQSAIAPSLEYRLVPDKCEKMLRNGQPLSNIEASDLFNLIKECELEGGDDDEDAKSTCRFAAAGTLVVLGSDWLSKQLDSRKHVIDVVRAGVEAIGSTGEGIRERRIGGFRADLKFVAYAVTHLWLSNGDGVGEWERAVLRLLTSGDIRSVAVVVDVAHANRDQLGTAWWRLLSAGLFWSGLITLMPQHSDGVGAERTWNVWLKRLRRFPLRGPNATPDTLDFARVVAGQERLDFRLRMRLYEASDRTWHRKPERERGGSLDSHFLGVLFSWLIEGADTVDRDLHTQLALRIWDYDVTRAKASSKKEQGEYDLPSQNLGYNILETLGALLVRAPVGKDRVIWEPVLAHGPAAHYALRQFIQGLFLRLGKDAEPVAFERIWRAMVEYCLSVDWSQSGFRYHGERLICDLLGFGNEEGLSRLNSGAALRMKPLFERWAAEHLVRDEDCIARFCHFLTTQFGLPLRLDGLRWLDAALKSREPPGRWYREETGEALVELLAVVVSSHAQALSQDVHARQALVDIAAALAALNIPTAFALQERIKRLR